MIPGFVHTYQRRLLALPPVKSPTTGKYGSRLDLPDLGDRTTPPERQPRPANAQIIGLDQNRSPTTGQYVPGQTVHGQPVGQTTPAPAPPTPPPSPAATVTRVQLPASTISTPHQHHTRHIPGPISKLLTVRDIIRSRSPRLTGKFLAGEVIAQLTIHESPWVGMPSHWASPDYVPPEQLRMELDLANMGFDRLDIRVAMRRINQVGFEQWLREPNARISAFSTVPGIRISSFVLEPDFVMESRDGA